MTVIWIRVSPKKTTVYIVMIIVFMAAMDQVQQREGDCLLFLFWDLYYGSILSTAVPTITIALGDHWKKEDDSSTKA